MKSHEKNNSKQQSEKVTISIANMIVKDYLCLSILLGEGFTEFVNIISPGFNIPSRNTVKSRIEKMNEDQEMLLNLC